LAIVKPVVCQNRDHLESFFHHICKERPQETLAEGVILRDPKAWYFKSDSFLKKKVTYYNLPMIDSREAI
jgi:hypothetical protein